MYDLARTKFGKQGKCELCGAIKDNLERHHIRYNPEITRMLCHKCHFTAHYYPERLPDTSKFLLLNKIMPVKAVQRFIFHFGKDRVELAKAFAPSRRASIRKAQKEKKEKK